MASTPVTIPVLQQMKRVGMSVDFISVGGSVGVNLWGHANPLEVIASPSLARNW